METLFWFKRGKEGQGWEHSPNVAGGGRTNVPSADCIGGICRVPTMTVERIDPEVVRPAPQRDPRNSLNFESKCTEYSKKGVALENIPNEKQFVQEQRLKFI